MQSPFKLVLKSLVPIRGTSGISMVCEDLDSELFKALLNTYQILLVL